MNTQKLKDLALSALAQVVVFGVLIPVTHKYVKKVLGEDPEQKDEKKSNCKNSE